MVAHILDEDPMIMEHSNFDLDLIRVILDAFDDDRVAKSLLLLNRSWTRT